MAHGDGPDLGGPGELTLAALPDRLTEGLDRFAAAEPYAELRAASAAWLRGDSGEAGGAFGRELVGLEPLLDRSFLLGQPNLAGMGVGAWDLAVRTAAEADVGRADARARRMIGRRGPLAGLFPEDETEKEAPEDPGARARGADLVEAIQRLDVAAGALPEDAPADLRDRVVALRVDLFRRLQRERRHDPKLSALLAELDLSDPGAPAALRGAVVAPAALADPARAVPLARPAPSQSPYEAALDAAVAQERRRPDLAPADPERLAAVRATIAREGQRALAADADSDQGRRLVERVRRLLAEEVALTGGRPAAGGATLDIRRALADRPGTSFRPAARGDAAVAPRADLPEVPILSSRGPKARVVGYLRAGEAAEAQREREGHVRVSVPGRQRPGWIPKHLLGGGPAWPSALESPDALPRAVSGRPPQGPGGGLAPLAGLVARETGQSPGELVRDAQQAPPPLPPPPRPRRARGAAAGARAPAPVRVGQVDVSGLDGPGGRDGAAVLNVALARLPRVLEARLAGDPGAAERLREGGRVSHVDVPLDVNLKGDPQSRGRALAERIADALLRAGGAFVDTLHLGVQLSGGAAEVEPRQALLSRLASEDAEGIAELLRGERKQLDETTRGRLAGFFGTDFGDVMVFAGPMAGALARSLSAEAVTHGKLVFFDPQHFRPDTAKGQALMAHELAHTRQADDRDVRMKEAEALATEAAYLDWIQPGGAPLVEEQPLDPTAPSAADAGDAAAGGFHRAKKGRELSQAQGPREDTQKHEDRVKAVLEKVRELLEQDGEIEGARIGDLSRFFSGPI